MTTLLDMVGLNTTLTCCMLPWHMTQTCIEFAAVAVICKLMQVMHAIVHKPQQGYYLIADHCDLCSCACLQNACLPDAS